MSAIQLIVSYIGIAYIAVGLGALLNLEYYKKLLEKEYIENRPVVYLNGYIILAIGFFMISLHNVWIIGWPVIITLFGWFAFIKGLAMLILPRLYLKISQSLKRKQVYIITEAVFIIIGGILLFYLGNFIL